MQQPMEQNVRIDVWRGIAGRLEDSPEKIPKVAEGRATKRNETQRNELSESESH
jgi:hypothetical protein